MFNTASQIVTSIRRSDGEKPITMRWPTDEEWIQRQRGWFLYVTRLGRGVSENTVDSEKADAALYNSIRLADSPDLSPLEASKLIQTLTECSIMNVTLGADDALVEMRVLNNEPVTHRLTLPTTADVMQFRRSSMRSLDLPHGRQQMRLNLQPGLEMYNRCHVESTGYANGVPVIHKDAAIRAVIDACETPQGEDVDF